MSRPPLSARTMQIIAGYTVPVVLAVALTIASVQAGTATGPSRAWWWLFTIVAAVLVAARAVWREHKASAAIMTANLVADHLTDRLHEEGQPLLGALCDLTNATTSQDRHPLCQSWLRHRLTG